MEEGIKDKHFHQYAACFAKLSVAVFRHRKTWNIIWEKENWFLVSKVSGN
jgi:hypothetical protein